VKGILNIGIMEVFVVDKICRVFGGIHIEPKNL
jgi:hypothetical protein